MYVCNMMTQPGETDDFKASDHIKALNKYLGRRKVDIIIANDGIIEEDIIKKYQTEEQKDEVELDIANLDKLKLEVIHDNFVDLKDGVIRHKVDKLSLAIYAYLIK